MTDEFETMRILEKAVLDLGEDERKARVVQWFISRFAEGLGGLRSTQNPSSQPTTALGPNNYESFAELFDAAGPTIERDKALIAAHWIQVCQGQPNFASQTLNDELKNLGHGIGNITEALNQLRDDRPSLILQLKKSGLTKQARKTYKLTQEGIKRVQSMIRTSIREAESE